MGISEDRRHERVPVRIGVREVYGRGEARTTNLSAGGFYMQHYGERKLRAGQLLDVVLDVPGGSIRAVGKVVRNMEEVFYAGARVKFVSITSKDRARIDRFVRGRRLKSPVRGTPLARIPLVRATR